MDIINKTNIFGLSENGFNFINILMIIAVLVGLILSLLFFRKNLNGKKIMFLGGELIFLGFVFNFIVDYKIRYPALCFITILAGLVISFIGLAYKNN